MCIYISIPKCIYVCMYAAAKSLQSCPTLCDPRDGRPSSSTVPPILQGSTVEQVAISFSNACKWKVKVKPLSNVGVLVTPWTQPIRLLCPWDFSRQKYWSTIAFSGLQYSNQCPKLQHQDLQKPEEKEWEKFYLICCWIFSVLRNINYTFVRSP